jgi:hypothetical protein
MVMLPTGLSGQLWHCHARSFSIVVFDAVWCQKTANGGEGNPPDERERASHPALMDTPTCTPTSARMSGSST